MYEPPDNSRRPKNDMKQVPYWEPSNISRHHTRFISTSDLATGISAPYIRGDKNQPGWDGRAMWHV